MKKVEATPPSLILVRQAFQPVIEDDSLEKLSYMKAFERITLADATNTNDKG